MGSHHQNLNLKGTGVCPGGPLGKLVHASSDSHAAHYRLMCRWMMIRSFCFTKVHAMVLAHLHHHVWLHASSLTIGAPSIIRSTAEQRMRRLLSLDEVRSPLNALAAAAIETPDQAPTRAKVAKAPSRRGPHRLPSRARADAAAVASQAGDEFPLVRWAKRVKRMHATGGGAAGWLPPVSTAWPGLVHLQSPFCCCFDHMQCVVCTLYLVRCWKRTAPGSLLWSPIQSMAPAVNCSCSKIFKSLS